MKITPIDIRQKTFDKKTFGGVDKEEVQAFLNTISQAWEKLLDENKDLRGRLETAERDSAKFREVENVLFKTIKTAEQSSANLMEQTRKDAELSLKEANMRSESILKDAQWRAKTIIEEAEEEARKTYKALQQEIKSLEIEYRTVENQRDNLLNELLNLAKDIEDRVNRSLDRTQVNSQPIALTTSSTSNRRANVPKAKAQTETQAPQILEPVIPVAPLFADLDLNVAATPLPEAEPENKDKESDINTQRPSEGSFFDQFQN